MAATRAKTGDDGEAAWAALRDAAARCTPSYLLRIPDEATKRREFAEFVHDLKALSRRLRR